MKYFNQVLLFLLVISILVLSLLVRPAEAQNTITVTYSAANCVPGSNGAWGNTDGDPDGFFFNRQSGAFVNTETNGEYLYCPVPYNYISSDFVSIIVSVYDASSRTKLDVTLYGRSKKALYGATALSNGKMLNADNTVADDTAAIRFKGDAELELYARPRIERFPFLWLTIRVPVNSAVIGYVVTQQQ